MTAFVDQWHFRPNNMLNGLSASTLCGFPIIAMGDGRKYLTMDPDWVKGGGDDCEKCAMLLMVAKANGFDPKAPNIEEKLESVVGRIRI